VAIQSGFPLVSQSIEILNRRRKLAIREIQKIPGIHFNEPAGAFYLFLDLREVLDSSHDGRRQTSLEFAENLINKHYLVAVPGEAFGAPGFLRLSYSVSEAHLIEGVRRIKNAIEKKESFRAQP
jgi:aspartate aminotransferase